MKKSKEGGGKEVIGFTATVTYTSLLPLLKQLHKLLDRAAENAYETQSNRRDKIPLGELRYELRTARDSLGATLRAGNNAARSRRHS